MAGKLTKGRRALYWITGAVVVIVVLYSVLSRSIERRVAAKMAHAEAAGFPFKGSDLTEAFEKPASENAAPYYDHIKAKANSLTYTDAQLGRELAEAGVVAAFTHEEWDALAIYLAEYEPVLADIEKGSKLPYCYFPKDWDLGYMVLFPEYADLKTVTKHLASRMRLRIHEGDIDGAIEDLDTLSAFAGHVRQQPILIGLLVSIACDSIISKAIEVELPAAARDPRLLAAFRRYAEGKPESWNLSGVIASEAFFSYWGIENIAGTGKFSEIYSYGYVGAGSPRKSISSYVTDAAMASPYSLRKIKSAVLDVWTPTIAEYRPGDDEKGTIEALERRFSEATQDSLFAEVYLDIMSPVYAGFWQSLYRARAQRRMLLAALDLIEHRSETGAWPESLDSAYIDPFDGKPLRYRIDGDGFRIWSVGWDGNDDGGVTRKEDNDNWDDVLVYPLVLVPFESPNAQAGPAGFIPPPAAVSLP